MKNLDYGNGMIRPVKDFLLTADGSSREATL